MARVIHWRAAVGGVCLPYCGNWLANIWKGAIAQLVKIKQTSVQKSFSAVQKLSILYYYQYLTLLEHLQNPFILFFFFLILLCDISIFFHLPLQLVFENVNVETFKSRLASILNRIFLNHAREKKPNHLTFLKVVVSFSNN